jgi:transcriptional regulator GlxA family with amidase domain
LIEALPRVIKSGASHNSDNTWLGQFIRIAVVEAAEKRAGSETVLTKLSELMFIEVLRRHIETLPADNAGWLAGLRDPSVCKVMSLLHDTPAHDWTLETLPKQSGLSRSVLAERFAEVVGIPPMHYLAKWRMQLASELLTTSNASVAGIAADIGYESEASFSRAFKKMIGVPPSGWRRKRL